MRKMRCLRQHWADNEGKHLRRVGDVFEVSDRDAKRLLRLGYAEYATGRRAPLRVHEAPTEPPTEDSVHTE